MPRPCAATARTSRICACRWSWWTWPISCRGCDFKVFAGPAADPNGRVTALCVPQGGRLSRKEIDDYTAYVARYGAKGLAYIKVNEIAKGRDGLQSPILKFLSDAAVSGILERTRRRRRRSDFLRRRQRQSGERRLRRAAPQSRPGFEAGRGRDGGPCGWSISRCSSGTPRPSAGRPCIIPFTSPANLDYAALAASPGEATAKAYDMVLNGSEIGGGSVRIHSQELQSVVFDLLGISPEEAQAQIRILARCAQVRRAAPWRHRLRAGPPGDADGRRGQHSRRHRIPENADGGGSSDGCADRGERGAAAGIAHPRARSAQGRVRITVNRRSAIQAAGIGLDRDPYRWRRVSVAGAAQAARLLAIGDRQPGMGRDRGCGGAPRGRWRKPASRRGCCAICSGPRCTRSCRRSAKNMRPGITRNLEHAFSLALAERVPVTLSDRACAVSLDVGRRGDGNGFLEHQPRRH